MEIYSLRFYLGLSRKSRCSYNLDHHCYSSSFCWEFGIEENKEENYKIAMAPWLLLRECYVCVHAAVCLLFWQEWPLSPNHILDFRVLSGCIDDYAHILSFPFWVFEVHCTFLGEKVSLWWPNFGLIIQKVFGAFFICVVFQFACRSN